MALPPLEYRPPAGGRRRRHWKVAAKVTLAIAVPVGIAFGVAVFYVGSVLRQQSVNMERARAHIPVVRAALAGDTRFADLQFEDFTGGNGSLMIDGTVDSERALDVLRSKVASTSPPVRVVWAVTIRPAPPAAAGGGTK